VTVAQWPRMMRKTLAAQYCDLSVAAFEREVAAGRLPMPVSLGGREHWCKAALDKALDAIVGDDAMPEWRKDLERRYG
jgi:predicted DNA-binding transcriptional regulator AlpA